MNQENRNINDENKVFEFLRTRLKDYKEEPDKKLWQNIEKHTHKQKFNAIKTIVFCGIVLLGSIIVALCLAPKNNNGPTKKEYSQIPNIETNLTNRNEVNTPTKSTTTTPPLLSVKKNTKNNTLLSNNTQTNNAVTSVESDKITKQTNNIQSITNNTPINTQNNSTISDNNKTNTKTISSNADKSTISTNKNLKTSEKTSTTPPKNESQTTNTNDKLVIPNAFQPTSNDEKLKTFKPAYKEVKNYHMRIFTRNGVQVFSSKDITIGWNGTIKGSLADKGTYIYFISYENLNGIYLEQKGTMLLYR